MTKRDIAYIVLHIAHLIGLIIVAVKAFLDIEYLDYGVNRFWRHYYDNNRHNGNGW